MSIKYEEQPLPAVSQFPFDISHWGGLNKVDANQQDYEMSDCFNMSSDNFPYASPKKERKLLKTTNAKRIFKCEGDYVYYINSNNMLSKLNVKTGDNSTLLYSTSTSSNVIYIKDCTCTVNYDKSSVFFSKTLKYIDEKNTPHGIDTPINFGQLPALSRSILSSDERTDEYDDGTGFEYEVSSIFYVSNTNATKINLKMELPKADSYAYPNTNALNIPKIRIRLYNSTGEVKTYTSDNTQYSYFETSATITDKTNTYAISIPTGITLESGDYFILRLGYYNTSNNFTESVIEKQLKYALKAKWTITSSDTEENITSIKLDYGVVYNNRIVGVSKNEIRASALGDFTNFWEYADEAGNASATGAYATNVGSAGDFTGICVYNNVLLLFKRNLVYEMYGSMPYTITELCSTGCIDNDSICEIDGVLYWASPKGIVRYSGGMPTVISYETDILTDGTCKCGTDGRKYYVYDGHKNFVYDTIYKMWHIEDDKKVLNYQNIGCDLYMICDDGIYQANKSESRVDWSFETKRFDFSSSERKNLSKLWIRAEMEQNTKLEVFVKQDKSDWIRCAVKTAERDEMFDFKLRIKKCDSFKIKFKGIGNIKILDIHGKVTVGTQKHRSGASLNVYRR